MSKLFDLMARNPVRTMAVVAALTAGLAPILPAWIIATLNGVLAALLGVGVHGVVTPVTKAATQITQAATLAATQTAQALTDATVGVTGEITDAARATINGVVHEVVSVLPLGTGR